MCFLERRDICFTRVTLIEINSLFYYTLQIRNLVKIHLNSNEGTLTGYRFGLQFSSGFTWLFQGVTCTFAKEKHNVSGEEKEERKKKKLARSGVISKDFRSRETISTGNSTSERSFGAQKHPHKWNLNRGESFALTTCLI